MTVKKTTFSVLILVALIASALPAAFVVREAGGLAHWQDVMPRGTTDSLYYYARIHEVADGHPFVGNPFAYEHREDLSPAFFLPDILTALPVLVGLPFPIAMIVNVFLWSLIFLALGYVLLRRLGLPPRWSVVWTVAAYAASYSFMLRPTVMQVVYPALLLFLLALVSFMREPLARRRAIWLAAASALAFYVYTYLAYVVVFSLAFLLVSYLATRRFRELRALLSSGLIAGVFLIPFVAYSLVQMHDPNYFATFVRIGLVYTHIPSIEAYYYGRWIAVTALLSTGLLWFGRKDSMVERLLWLSSGVGLILSLFLNVATGVELSLGVHIGRIAIPWLPLALGAGIHEWREAHLPGLKKNAIAILLLVVVLFGVAASIERGFDFFGFNRRGVPVADVQAYAAPLSWLRTHVREQSVIWSDDSLAQYIPIMTQHYPLFSEGVALHIVSDQEVVDRYLLSRNLLNLTVADLKRDLGLYTGGVSKSAPLAVNQRASVCRALVSFTGPRDCPAYTDGMTLRGDAYFDQLERSFAESKKNQSAFLARYHVRYLLVDRASDAWKLPARPILYDDGRFVIMSL